MGGTEGAQPALPVFPMQRDCWEVEEVIRIPDKEVKNWIMPRMPGWCG